jgi:hypothetical protein
MPWMYSARLYIMQGGDCQCRPVTRKRSQATCHSSDRSLAETIVVNYIWGRLVEDASVDLRRVSHGTFRKV